MKLIASLAAMMFLFGMAAPSLVAVSTDEVDTSTSVAPPSALRRLKTGKKEMCNNTAYIDYYINAFGPSNRSLFFGIDLPYEVDGELISVDIASLAKSYKEATLVIYGFSQANETFGRNGERTEEVLCQHALLKEFWKITSDDDVLVGGIHSEDMKDDVASAVYAWAYLNYKAEEIGITDEDIINAAEQVAQVIETELPNSYSNPLLAYGQAQARPFFPTKGFENATVILLDDGFFDFYESLGLGTVGNDLVHAHEFGHALQYIMLFEDVGGDREEFKAAREVESPEANRFGELEADAMAAYFLAHEQGQNFAVPLLMDVSKAFFEIGDCEFDGNGHHGTPKQRECAALWAADEGLDRTGDPVSMREFRALFEQNYDLIVALDPSVCQLSE